MFFAQAREAVKQSKQAPELPTGTTIADVTSIVATATSEQLPGVVVDNTTVTTITAIPANKGNENSKKKNSPLFY